MAIKFIKTFIEDWNESVRHMKGIQGYRWQYTTLLKNYYCPYCRTFLRVVRETRVVNSASEEAKDFDFSSAMEGSSMIGNVQFSFDAFYCPKCDARINITKMLKYELDVKKYQRRLERFNLRKEKAVKKAEKQGKNGK